ncbi:hypothetical protein FHW03_004982 [Ochrobactrum sp. RH2CCR150]|nr:hypothetical protein [Ochrobactrum sp. RH2CCR150]
MTRPLGPLYPFPQEIDINAVFKRKPRYRDPRFKTGCNKTIYRSWVISTSSVTTHKPHPQSLLIFFHDLVSTYFGGHFMPESTTLQKVRRNSRLRITVCPRPLNQRPARPGITGFGDPSTSDPLTG